ncbi:hypothetical protein HK105_204261 [Polyrhizophydium stewartii]|uniref:B30.2/SPRY domain-containing protein n=1 Tax=Polyrhizophydium stewartii TaxID=2732419 RepID=A0ABR4N9H5_9FUNG
MDGPRHKNNRRLQGPTHHQRELQSIRELCGHLKQLVDAQRSEAIFRRNQDFLDLKDMTEKSKRDDELSLLGIEASMGIINIGLRKQALRMRLVNRLTDEKELSNMMQNHKEDFTQFIWKRRLQSRRDLRLLFQTGPGMIGRFGDLIADSTLEAIQSFERSNWAQLCKEAISSGICDYDDVSLVSVKTPGSRINVFQSRLEFQIDDVLENSSESKDLERWFTVYATSGPWAVKLYSKPLVTEVVNQGLEQIRHLHKDTDTFSYVHILSRMVDMVHPTHQLQATVLAYPLYGVQILKRRVAALGYDLGNANEDSVLLDHKLAADILRQIHKRLEKEQRFYFEWTSPPRTKWRVGLMTGRHIHSTDHNVYPGQDAFSFGFGHDGQIFNDGESVKYLEDYSQVAALGGVKTWGLVIDLFHGSLHLVVDGKMVQAAFGKNAAHFDQYEQDRQRHLILTNQLIPMIALQDGMNLEEKPLIKLNFGEKQFVYNLNVTSVNSLMQPLSTKGIDLVSVLDITGSNAHRERLSQEEDEKLHTSLEKNYFRVSLIPDTVKSFSQFPPSVYRRSLAATRIQRAWRRFQGRKMRERIRKEQYEAAVLIQRMARKKLRKIREVKNESAAKIQKFWRRKKFIWIALLRCIYQQPIPELHRAATVIQRKWRHWHMFKNSPLASKYQTKIEDLEKAVNKIIQWWRPLHSHLAEINEARRRNKAATDIQRVFRGYYLRQLLRPDLRLKLTTLGAAVAKARHNLLEIRGAYVLQNAWRNKLQRRIRAEKVKTRNKAATRIQSLWRGFWVRSHTPLRFTYGEAVFLTAVCKALRQSHFILKMYRPCGIVCPKPEQPFNRDHR